ncbi:hypothetical protein AGDE_14658 [Angomonas deanei]|nr:hypothetical protein AGDE_14658 [Angomonas deanei]|eukprot:EPY20463.1 hypothetical protein AGDE_14658 [Angomonas deanei]
MSRGSSRGNASLVSDTSRSPPTLTGITAVTKRLGGNHNEEGDTNSTNNGMEASLNSAEGTEANAQGDLLSPGSSLSRRSTTSAGGVSTRTTAHMVNSFSNSLSTGTATEASLKNVSGSQRNTASSYVILRSEWGPEYYREQLFKPWNAFVDTLAEELVGTVLTWVTDCEGSDTWNSLVRVSPNCCYDRVHGMCLLRWNTLKEVKNYVEAAHSVINASMSLFFTPLTIGLEVLGQSVLCLSLAPVSSPWVDWLEAYPVQHAFQAMCASLRLLKPLKPSEMTQVSGGDDASSPLGRPVNGFHKPARETNGESGTEGEKKFSVFFSNATLENIASHVDNIRGGARRLRGNEMRGRNFTNTRLHAFLVASGADARWYMLDARALCYFQNYSRASYTAALVPRPEMYSSPVGVLMRDCGPNEFILHSKLTNIVAQLLNGVSSENSILVSTICHSHGVHFGSYVFPLLDLLKTEEKQLTASLQNSQRNGGSSPAVQARLSQCSKCCQGIIGELIARVIKSLLMQEWHNLTRAVDPQWVLRMRRSLSSVEGKRELYKAYKGGLGGSATPEVSLPLNGNTATSNNNSDVSFEDDYLVDFLRELSELDQPLLDKYLHLLDGIFRVGVGEDAAASYDGTSPGVSNTSFSNTAISRFSKNTAIGDGSGFSFGRNGTAKGNRLTYPAFNSALFSIQFREDMFEELLTIVNDVYVYKPYLAGEKAEEWQVLKKKPVVQLRRARDNNNRGSNNGNHAGRYDTSDDDKIRVKHNELYAGWTLQCLQEMLAVPLVLRNNSITVDRRSGDSKVLEPLLFGKTDKGRYPLRARSKLFRNTIEIPLVLKLGSIEKMQEYSYEQNEIGLRVASIPYHMGPGTSTDKNLHYARSGKYIQMYAADIRIACRGWMVTEDFDFMQQNNIGGAGRTRGYRPSAARQGSLMGRRRGADNPFNIGAVDDTRSRSAFLLYTSFRQCYLNGKSDLPEALTALWQFNEQTEALCEGSNTLSYLLRLKVSLLANMGSNYAASIITRGLESAASDLDVLTGGVLNRRYLSSNSPGNSHNASNTRPENGNFHDRGNSSISDSTGSWARELYHPSTHAALRNNGASVSAQSTSTEAMLNPLLPEYEESIPILQYNTTVKAEKVSELRPIQCGELFFALLTLLVKHMFVVDPQRSERESWKRAVQFCGVRREIVVVCYGEHSVEAAIAMNDLALLLLQVPETYSQAKEELLKAERNLQGYLWFLRTQLKGEEGAEIDGSNNTTQILAVESRKRSSSTQIIDNGSSNPHRADGNIALVLPVSNSLELGNKSRSGRDGLLPTGINNNDSLGSLSATTNFKNRLLIFRSFDQMRGDDNRIPSPPWWM